MARQTSFPTVKAAVSNFPSLRFMGSKRRLLGFIREVTSELKFDSVLDAFSGSGIVSYLFKTMGKTTFSNDYMAFCYRVAKATIENSKTTLTEEDVKLLLKKNRRKKDFIQKTFNGLYFTPEENAFLDNVSANITELGNDHKKSIAISALCRAALKKQPRGVFTVTGKKYDDGRRDLKISMEQQFLESISAFNSAIFDNQRRNRAFGVDVFQLPKLDADLVYIDPPYWTPHSDNDYIRRYHFIEGLATYWRGVKLIKETKTKRIEKRDTPFDSREHVYDAFEELFTKFPGSMLLISYSSNSIPTKEEMLRMLKKYRRHVEVFECRHRYSFGNQKENVGKNRNLVKEYLFLGY